MNLEKFLGSKTKSDIIKYLVFKRQGVSMRALEQELERTFPAIKKQIDSLEESDILVINKNAQARSIEIHHELYPIINQLVIIALKQTCEQLIKQHQHILSNYYYGKLFDVGMDHDLVVLFHQQYNQELPGIKEELNAIFHDFFIEHASVVFMSEDEFRKRINMADKFALSIMRAQNNKSQ